ncbi:MAG: adenylyltransferase/cytidyltransferase family protein [Elusimicrobia bacterium]|nr:adenylyltransferase/cytidyltransferase family protein [Elusimicrobiota bacterium]
MPALNSRDKIKTLKRLLELREAWRWEGKTVVFTNGVFDLLHAGHVQSLEKARSLGDVLVVGLNSDASARRLGKGPGRPINAWKDRAAVLAALSCVDAVVAFGEDTPAELLSRLKPDVLAKGADYRKNEVAGRQYAGRVVLIPLAPGRSTSALIEKISRLARRRR